MDSAGRAADSPKPVRGKPFAKGGDPRQGRGFAAGSKPQRPADNKRVTARQAVEAAVFAIDAAQQAAMTLQRLLEKMSPHDMAKAATKPALRYALETIEDEKRDHDDRLRAAAMLLQQGHGRAVDKSLVANIDANTVVRRVTPEAMYEAALKLIADVDSKKSQSAAPLLKQPLEDLEDFVIESPRVAAPPASQLPRDVEVGSSDYRSDGVPFLPRRASAKARR